MEPTHQPLPRLSDTSSRHFELLLLQVLGGYSFEEIGELLGLLPGAVMTRLSRARQKLRHSLEQEDDMPRSKDMAP